MSTPTQHSPGPWSRFDDQVFAGGWAIAQVYTGDHSPEEPEAEQRRLDAVGKANLRLMTAAPDLLAATEKSLGFVRHALEFWDWRYFPVSHEAAEQLRDELVAALRAAKGGAA